MSFKEWLNKMLSNPVPEPVAQPVPPAPIEPLRFFSPNYDFFSPELKSQYLKNATYTIRPGASYDKLRALANGEWTRRGMIRFLPAHPGNGQASGATILGSALVKEK